MPQNTQLIFKIEVHVKLLYIYTRNWVGNVHYFVKFNISLFQNLLRWHVYNAEESGAQDKHILNPVKNEGWIAISRSTLTDK